MKPVPEMNQEEAVSEQMVFTLCSYFIKLTMQVLVQLFSNSLELLWVWLAIHKFNVQKFAVVEFINQGTDLVIVACSLV